jgi:hypothetical protein
MDPLHNCQQFISPVASLIHSFLPSLQMYLQACFSSASFYACLDKFRSSLFHLLSLCCVPLASQKLFVLCAFPPPPFSDVCRCSYLKYLQRTAVFTSFAMLTRSISAWIAAASCYWLKYEKLMTALWFRLFVFLAETYKLHALDVCRVRVPWQASMEERVHLIELVIGWWMHV